MIEKSVLTHRLSALEEYLADLDEISKDLDYLRIDPEIVYTVLTKHSNDIAVYANIIKSKYL